MTDGVGFEIDFLSVENGERSGNGDAFRYGTIDLIPANDSFPPEIVTEGDAILGRVVWM